MKIKKTIEVTKIICDICSCECHNHTAIFLPDGIEMHGCDTYNEDEGKTCATMLKEKLAPKIRRSDTLSSPSIPLPIKDQGTPVIEKKIKIPTHSELLQRWIDLSKIPDSQEKTASIEALTNLSSDRIKKSIDIVILIDGGMLHSVCADAEDANVILIDRDDEEAGGEVPDYDEVTAGLNHFW